MIFIKNIKSYFKNLYNYRLQIIILISISIIASLYIVIEKSYNKDLSFLLLIIYIVFYLILCVIIDIKNNKLFNKVFILLIVLFLFIKNLSILMNLYIIDDYQFSSLFSLNEIEKCINIGIKDLYKHDIFVFYGEIILGCIFQKAFNNLFFYILVYNILLISIILTSTIVLKKRIQIFIIGFNPIFLLQFQSIYECIFICLLILSLILDYYKKAFLTWIPLAINAFINPFLFVISFLFLRRIHIFTILILIIFLIPILVSSYQDYIIMFILEDNRINKIIDFFTTEYLFAHSNIWKMVLIACSIIATILIISWEKNSFYKYIYITFFILLILFTNHIGLFVMLCLVLLFWDYDFGFIVFSCSYLPIKFLAYNIDFEYDIVIYLIAIISLIISFVYIKIQRKIISKRNDDIFSKT